MPRVVLLETSRQSTFDNRVGWARTYLKNAGLLANPRRGVMNITDRGREVLSTSPDHINVSLLEQRQGQLLGNLVTAESLGASRRIN